MARQSAQHTRPDRDRSRSMAGFSVPPPVWMIPPAAHFEFFDITHPHFYVIHGVPMAFVPPGEVRP